MLPSIHLFCLHGWSCRPAVSTRSATQLVASYIGFSSTIRLRVLLQLPPRNNVLVSIAALPDVAQFEWTMCSVEQAALHTLASHLVHFKKLTVFKGRPTRCTNLPSFHRASHHWCSVTACAASTAKIRDCKFATAVFSPRVCGCQVLSQFETPPVSQRHEPPCVDSVGSPRNSAQVRAHGQPQSNRRTTHQHDASCQCSPRAAQGAHLALVLRSVAPCLGSTAMCKSQAARYVAAVHFPSWPVRKPKPP